MQLEEQNSLEKIKDKKHFRIIILEIVLMVIICAAILLITKFIL
jgi:flagellar basal body-associated protein FliL